MSNQTSVDIQNQQQLKTNIQTLFLQLSRGCGRAQCNNQYCAANTKIPVRPVQDCVKLSFELATSLTPNSPVLCRTATCVTAQQLVDTAKEAISNGRLNEFLPILKSIFSSNESLNISFDQPTIRADDPNLGVDLDGFKKFLSFVDQSKSSQLFDTLKTASEQLLSQLSIISPYCVTIQSIRQFLILLELNFIYDYERHRTHFLPLADAINKLPEPSKSLLVRYWSTFDPQKFKTLLAHFHEFITMRLLLPPLITNITTESSFFVITKTMKLLNEANELKQIVPYTEFYNDIVKDKFENSPRELIDDFKNWKTKMPNSFCFTPFILDPSVKSRVLHIESIIEQSQYRNEAFRQLIMQGTIPQFQLKLQVSRTNLIETSLSELARYSREDLKRQLVVVFEHEEAKDEGGVQKEWFQLLSKEIFDPKYGMFVFDSTTNLYWFDSRSQDWVYYDLIGKLLGLAIYNSVILDLHFPHIVYKKLMNVKPTLADLKDTHPGLYVGFQKLLAFEGDVEEVYDGVNFQVTYEYFGEQRKYDLKPNGGSIPITNANREEYVQLYVKYLLEDSVARQWKEFERGFKSVCDSDAFKLFRHEELELLVCGSPVLDFNALQQAAQYENGFSKDHPFIKSFWELIHSFDIEKKKKLLMFVTGSARAPIGGLGNLRMVIGRAGGDSESLPSAHTCFNHLLLPEYKTKDKLKSRLETALELGSEGFGML